MPSLTVPQAPSPWVSMYLCTATDPPDAHLLVSSIEPLEHGLHQDNLTSDSEPHQISGYPYLCPAPIPGDPSPLTLFAQWAGPGGVRSISQMKNASKAN